MFCPNCGTDNPTGAFCKNCGTPLNTSAQSNEQAPAQPYQPAAQPYNPTPAQPYQPVAQPYPAVSTPALSRKEFANSVASKGYKSKSLICLIMALVLVASLIGSYFLVLNTSFDKLPLVSAIIKSEGEDFDEVMYEIRSDSYMMRSELNAERSFLTDNEYKILDKYVTCAEKCGKNFSIQNTRNLVKAAEKVGNSNTSNRVRYYVPNSDLRDIKEINEVLDLISGIILGFMIFALCFTAPGALCKVRGLVIVGSIFTQIYSALFCPIWATILLILLHIVVIVFISMVRNEYKAYVRNPQQYIQNNS